LSTHLDALQRAREIARRYPKPRPVLIHLVDQERLWGRREFQHALLLRVHLAYQHASPEVWESLLRCALGSCTPESDQPFQEFGESEEFNEMVLELEAHAAPPDFVAKGRAHDLEQSFARVNAAFFDNRMPKPRLTWNRMLTARKIAHYQSSGDTVMMSVTLDDPAVSTHLLDFVMYHELLHKKHGVTRVNGQRVVHGPAFRAEERQYPGYQEAERQIHALALRQRGIVFNQ
jgi:hypothetical protein